VNVGAADMPIGCARTFCSVFSVLANLIRTNLRNKQSRATSADGGGDSASRDRAFPVTRAVRATKI
jgi:hypothetical protein